MTLTEQLAVLSAVLPILDRAGVVAISASAVRTYPDYVRGPAIHVYGLDSWRRVRAMWPLAPERQEASLGATNTNTYASIVVDGVTLFTYVPRPPPPEAAEQLRTHVPEGDPTSDST